ncbi:unnamed protein product, partial [Symbiodinium microadriaticum]
MVAPLSESAVADLQRSHGRYIYHGTDVHVVDAIVAQGLQPGGGPGGRLANHFVVGPMPTQWSEARGFRRGSNAVVQCDLEVLLRVGVQLFSGADGVLLADTVPVNAIFRILAADNRRGDYTDVADEPARGLYAAQPRSCGVMTSPDATLAAPSGEGLDTVVRWHLHRAACHEVLLPRAVFPEPTNTDQIRQDYRESGSSSREKAPRARLACERACHSAEAGPPKKGGRNKAPSTLEPEHTPPRPPSGAGVEYTAGAASSEGAQPAADAPEQPIEFNPGQFYSWGSWVCYFCNGVNPPEAVECFYQPSGGPHE